MQRIYEQMYEQYRNKKSREAFIQLPMQWGATVHPIIDTYIILYMKKDQFTVTAPYYPVRLIVQKIRYWQSLSHPDNPWDLFTWLKPLKICFFGKNCHCMWYDIRPDMCLDLIIQCFQKKSTSEFWRICCNCSKMNCQYLPREKKRRRILCSAHKIFLSWSSYNIFFKILRYTSSEDTVIQCFQARSVLFLFEFEKVAFKRILGTFFQNFHQTSLDGVCS